MTERDSSTSPYKGLKPYSEQDAPFFFGRESDRRIILSNLMALRLTLLYGASGVGKSSVLHAGVAHDARRLARKKFNESGKPEIAIAVFNSWHGDPVKGLAECVKESVARMPGGKAIGAESPSSSLVETFRECAKQVDGRLLVILDQFEDYFLHHEDERGEGTFAFEFPRVVKSRDLKVNFLISIRDDAHSKLDFFEEDISNIFENQLRINHLDRAAARAAIKSPIEQYNRFYAAGRKRIGIEDSLVEEVIEQVRAKKPYEEDGWQSGSKGRSGENKAGASVEAPFLQLVMTKLWEEEMRLGSDTLRLETLNRLEGTKQIVKTHMTQVIESLSQEEQALADGAFHYMVTPSGEKRPYTAYDLASSAGLGGGELEALLEKLARGPNRILRAIDSPDSGGESLYEIFHDKLAQPILAWRKEYANRRAAENARAEEKAGAAVRRRHLLIAMAALVVVALAGLTIGWAESRRADAEQRMAVAERKLRERNQAVNVSSQVLAKLYNVIFGTDDPIEARDNYAAILGKLNQALDLYRRDDEQAGVGITLNNIGGLHRLVGQAASGLEDYEQAKAYYDQSQKEYQGAQEVLENSLGPDHTEVATSLNDLAFLHMLQGRYASAEPLFERATTILGKALDADDVYLADVIRNLAMCYQSQGEYDEAESLYNRVLEIRKQKRRGDHAEVAQSLNDLAWLYYEQGKYAQAEPLFNESLAIWQGNPDKGIQLNAALSLNGLAAIYRDARNYVRADQYLSRVRTLHNDVVKNDHLVLADNIENLALLRDAMGDFGPADALFTEALRIWGESLGKNHPTYAYGLSNQASLYYKRGRYAEAEARFKEALQVQEKALPHSPQLAHTLSGLARVYTDTGRYDEAEPLFEQAVTILDKATPAHPEFADTLNNYAALLRKMNRETEAAQLEQRAKQILDANTR